MNSSRWCVVSGLAALLAVAPALQAQQTRNLSIGYVYPAGAQQGTTSEHVIAGQFLTGVTNVYVSGGGVKATIADFIHPISGRELNDLRIQMDELLARKAVVRNDFRALEYFRSFKGAKNVKPDSATEDKDIADLKKKYAHATWTAEDDKLVNEVRRKMAGGVRKPANPSISELIVVQLTVAPNAELGQHEIRIGAPNGLSNPLAFCVGQLPEFSEQASKTITEQKSQIAKTAYAPRNRKAEPVMRITLPATANGQIQPGEVDRYRFNATKGQKLVMAVSARQLIPYIPDAVPGWFQATLALYDAKGKELAYDDDFRFNPDPVLYYEIPADGEYVIEIKDSIYRGREDFVYRITVGELPFVTSIFPLGGRAGAETSIDLKGWNLPITTMTQLKDKKPGVYSLFALNDKRIFNFVPFAIDTLPECLEKEPNNSGSHAQRVELPVIVNGRIDKAEDADVFRFEGRAGQEIVAEVYARRLNSPLDSVLKLTDASGKQLAFNDDHTDKGYGLATHHADSYLTATLPANGAYYVHMADTQHKGGAEYAYRLRISEPRPDFELRVVSSTISARVGSSVPLTVYALRKDGFAGEIALSLKDAPPGYKLGGGRVPAKDDKVKLTLTVPPFPQDEPVNLHIEGRARIGDQEVARAAVPAEDMMQAFEYRQLVPSKELKVTVAGRYSTKSVAVRILGDMPVKIPSGGTVKVQIASSAIAFAGKVHLELSDPPDGITIKDVWPTREGTEIVLQSDAATVKLGLKGNLIVTASSGKTTTPSKSKTQSGQKPVATLPAIPFEVVAK